MEVQNPARIAGFFIACKKVFLIFPSLVTVKPRTPYQHLHIPASIYPAPVKIDNKLTTLYLTRKCESLAKTNLLGLA